MAVLATLMFWNDPNKWIFLQLNSLINADSLQNSRIGQNYPCFRHVFNGKLGLPILSRYSSDGSGEMVAFQRLHCNMNDVTRHAPMGWHHQWFRRTRDTSRRAARGPKRPQPRSPAWRPWRNQPPSAALLCRSCPCTSEADVICINLHNSLTFSSTFRVFKLNLICKCRWSTTGVNISSHFSFSGV